MEGKITLHNFMGCPIQIITEEFGKVIDLPPEKSPFEITEIERIKDIVAVETGKDDVHIAIERNRVSLRSKDGFPGPKTGVFYIVPQIIVEAVRKSNRSTTRDLIVPVQENGFGPCKIHYANIVTELNLDDEETVNAANKTWQRGVQSIDRYKYPHESYASDR